MFVVVRTVVHERLIDAFLSVWTTHLSKLLKAFFYELLLIVFYLRLEIEIPVIVFLIESNSTSEHEHDSCFLEVVPMSDFFFDEIDKLLSSMEYVVDAEFSEPVFDMTGSGLRLINRLRFYWFDRHFSISMILGRNEIISEEECGKRLVADLFAFKCKISFEILFFVTFYIGEEIDGDLWTIV